MKILTKAEEQVMKVVWEIGGGLLMEIVEHMPDPKPHKNTVATILKTLTEKDFIRVKVKARIHVYKAAISRNAYSRSTLVRVAKGYFDGSFSNIVSFMYKNNELSLEDLEALLNEFKNNKR